eukprot:scaffold7646_cov102-Skeletonema_marinoi.AAC.1
MRALFCVDTHHCWPSRTSTRFAELEWGILSQQGNLDASKVLVVTTVHDSQVFDGGVEEPWKSLMEQQEKDGVDDDGTNSQTPFGSLTQHDVPVDII